jgi:hypothetical protein
MSDDETAPGDELAEDDSEQPSPEELEADRVGHGQVGIEEFVASNVVLHEWDDLEGGD